MSLFRRSIAEELDSMLPNLQLKPGSDRICMVAYHANSGRELVSSSSGVILVILEITANQLRVYVETNWREVVTVEDAPYFSEILDDLPERILHQPDETFSQFSTLSMGPLITEYIGECDSENAMKTLPLSSFALL